MANDRSYYVDFSYVSAGSFSYKKRWGVYRPAQRGGPRWVCTASSEAQARKIAKALNAQEATTGVG